MPRRNVTAFYLLHFAAVAALLNASCTRNHYVIEIRPDGEQFQRTLFAWQQSSGDQSSRSKIQDEEFERIAELYEERHYNTEEKKHVFTGRFQGATPSDVGGAGSLTYFTSPCGTLSIYVERFRGNDNLEEELAKRRAAADTLVDLLIGWFKTEMGNSPVYDDVHKLLDVELRRDIRNLGALGWSLAVASSYKEDVGQEFIVRALQYLAERDYFSGRDLPLLLRAFSANDDKRIAAITQRLVARKIGIQDGKSIPESLAFLGDPNKVETSLREYLRKTELYKQRLAKWRTTREKSPDNDEEPPMPLQILVDLSSDAVFKFQLSAADAVEVRLHPSCEPFATNGKWNDEDDLVSWSQSLEPNLVLPMLIFAAWSAPDRKTQTERFGTVVLERDDLGQFVMWYNSLTTEETSEWNEFLSTLKPGPDLIKKLKFFRFTTDQPTDPDAAEDEQPTSLADSPRKLILANLKQEE